MGNKMLIDAAHPEETRVVVLRGNRIEEFDFEAASKRQLRGNIYLAKVTRVEPSLQAAFIEYGGNRHGFLAFSEIHPDYYQIPVADRQALLEEEARSHADEEDEQPRSSRGGDRNGGERGGGDRNGGERGGGDRNGGERHGGDRNGTDRNGRRSRRHRRGDANPAAKRHAGPADEAVVGEAVHDEMPFEVAPETLTHDADAGAAAHEMPTIADNDEAPVAVVDAPGEPPVTADEQPVDAAVAAIEAVHEEPEGFDGDESDDDHHDVTTLEHGEEAAHETGDDAGSADHLEQVEHHGENGHDDDVVEQLGGDALEDVPHRVSRPRRHYKIQEVIKRRQVLLVQVVKEERGNKGAALTTYLSLAGRYSVLMPNTARGGGISRKITDAEDRKRLKAIAQELDVPDGMGIILRTAGAARGMPEVKRDFEYLMRMWETVRETTLRSSAPTLVYEEGSLIKRSIRDLFNKDVDEVMVSGEEAYREAKDFMRLLMPTHAKAVIHYRDPQPIFAKAGAEAQLDAMFSNQVTLRSGGYIVINQTEALVAIDVNSGRSTREHSIEDTALRTNLEAADEVARQLRLRDLAGLIVVDFIDMDESRNDRAVERRIKDALKNDRARIQIGRISHFGLLEMSRQRMRTGVLEGSTVMCPHCTGSGTVRSMSSIALHVLRLIEDALIKAATHNLIVRTRSEVALYILNQKRMNLLDLESRFGVAVTILADAHMTGAVYHAIERGSEATPPVTFGLLRGLGAPANAVEAAGEDEVDDDLVEADIDATDEDGAETAAADPATRGQPRPAASAASDDGEGGRRRRRRRRRRGGRDGLAPGDREHAPAQAGENGSEEAGDNEEFDQEDLSDIAAGFAPPEAVAIAEAHAEAAASSAPAEPVAEADVAPPADDLAETGAPVVAAVPASEEEPAEAPRRRRSRRAAPAPEGNGTPEVTEAAEPAAPTRRTRRPRARAGETALALDLAPPATPAGAPDAKPAPEPELPLAAVRPVLVPSANPVVAAPAAVADEASPPAAPEAAPAEDDPDRPKRSGWWQRAKATFSTGT